MTYIRCPECGARALNVATACPQCHHVLAQNPMQLGTSSELVVCRVCKKYTPRTSPSCQFCGASTRGAPVASIVKAVLLLAVAGGATWGGWVLWRSSAPEPAPVVPAATLPPSARPQPIVPPADTEAIPVAVPIAAEAPPAVATVTRWTSGWLNLRDGPGYDSNVLRPVPPGTRLEVADPVRGWWRVYREGEVVGFISGTELLPSPPDTAP